MNQFYVRYTYTKAKLNMDVIKPGDSLLDTSMYISNKNDIVTAIDYDNCLIYTDDNSIFELVSINDKMNKLEDY